MNQSRLTLPQQHEFNILAAVPFMRRTPEQRARLRTLQDIKSPPVPASAAIHRAINGATR